MESQPVQYFIMGVMTLTDARYFSAMGVDYLHFDLDPDSPHAISLPAWQAIVEWVAGSDIICSFDHLFDEDALREILENPIVSGVMSRHADLLHYVQRFRSDLKLFQFVETIEEIDSHLPLTGIIGPNFGIDVDHEFVWCNGPLEAQEAIRNGIRRIAIHPGSEDEIGIKDYEIWDQLIYQEF
ncbi:MAG TPA: hypothetical protein VKZ56_03755 [Membranihabitans sp.]|nr:hypothetical protein [Membranihabitans sp.]